MKILLDMNLSPLWAVYLRGHGFEAIHWSVVGEASAEDRVLMAWASAHGHILFTNDLDFTSLLAASAATAPSVIQLRAQNLNPARLGEVVVAALQTHGALLEQGAFVTIDEARARVRVLPLRSRGPGGESA